MAVTSGSNYNLNPALVLWYKLVIFVFLFGVPTTCVHSRDRDGTRATEVTRASAVITLDPLPTEPQENSSSLFYYYNFMLYYYNFNLKVYFFDEIWKNRSSMALCNSLSSLNHAVSLCLFWKLRKSSLGEEPRWPEYPFISNRSNRKFIELLLFSSCFLSHLLSPLSGRKKVLSSTLRQSQHVFAQSYTWCV